MADGKPHPGTEGKRQRRIADRPDVLVARQIIELHVHAQPLLHLVAAAYVDLRIRGVEVAIGQEQPVIPGKTIERGQESWMVAAASRNSLHLHETLPRRIA